MLTLPVEAWIGNAAAVVSGVWGAVTKRSEQSGYSRTAIYTHAQRVVEAVANEQATGLIMRVILQIEAKLDVYFALSA